MTLGMTTACDTVANTDNSPPYILSPTRSKKSRVVAVVFFLLFGCLAVASLYKLGPLSVSTPLQTGTKEPAVLNNETAMPPGKGIYGRKFPPSSIPAQDLTHILYAFANIRPNTGEVFLSDLWADQDIHYPGDSWSDSGTNLYGNFKAIYELKKRHRHLKLLLSIGGWTYSPSFHPVVVSPAHRAEFVRSAVSLNDAQARGYVELLRELRAALDEHARRKYADYRFLLTIAAPCGPDNYHKLHIREMVPLLDFWNLMAYDFSGSWDKVANHQANMFGGPISASQAVQWYISRGVPRHRVILGVPLYGRSFLHTDGPGTPFSGLGQGSWESGVYDYRALPLPGSYILRDERVMASWTYDYVHKEMISYDDEVVGRWKGEYIAQEGLGGSMFWELSGDKGGASREGMEGGHGKEGQPGRRSKFENLRKGM
ncbi:glycoside hydrolase family 18 protein [Lactarius sanguifluus]|nr:glycoside hydrolase family 18 protein [Lactarius sanguifluus]